MYIDPEIGVYLQSIDPDAPDFPELSIDEARAAMSAGIDDMRPGIGHVVTRNIVIPGPDGQIPLRIYRADEHVERPLTVFVHGGGWMVGTLDDYDRVLRRLCVEGATSIVSVGYRLAPEHPFPAAVDDVMTALAWADGHRSEIGTDEGYLGIAGDSSGGNIAGAAAQRVRDEGGTHIDHQLLIYPVVRRTFDSDSYTRFANQYLLTRHAMQYFWDSYVGAGSDRLQYADLLANDLGGLPATSIFACSLDPLCSENIDYANALAEAGVATTLQVAYGLVHSSWMKDAVSQRAHQLGLDIAAALRHSYSSD